MAITKATRTWIITTAKEYNIMEAELFNALLVNKRVQMKQGLSERDAIKKSKKLILEDLKRKAEEGV